MKFTVKEYLKVGGLPELIYQVKKDWIRWKCERLFFAFPECTQKNIAEEYMDQGQYAKALQVLRNA